VDYDKNVDLQRQKKTSENYHKSQAHQNGKITRRGGGIKHQHLERINVQAIKKIEFQ
jgi:hypothetical protein